MRETNLILFLFRKVYLRIWIKQLHHYCSENDHLLQWHNLKLTRNLYFSVVFMNLFEEEAILEKVLIKQLTLCKYQNVVMIKGLMRVHYNIISMQIALFVSKILTRIMSSNIMPRHQISRILNNFRNTYINNIYPNN